MTSDSFSRAALASSLHFVKISLHFPKLQGETGSNGTASSTTQFPECLFIEPLREKPALAAAYVE
jgi:hypothetical protein